MHFYYLDESGCTGADLVNADQPIFVLGGVSLRDEGWVRTQERFTQLISAYFEGHRPADFELHANELLSPHGDGPFSGHQRARRNELVLSLLTLLEERRHNVHFVAFDKSRINAAQVAGPLNFEAKIPYLVAFDSMVTSVDWLIRHGLGRSARGMIIFDTKDEFAESVERIIHGRRFEGATRYRVKRIVEFAYPADSYKNPMVQFSDLVTFCVRKFLEVDNGYRDSWPPEAKQFYAICFDKIYGRLRRKALVLRPEPAMTALNTYLVETVAVPVGHWRRRYGLDAHHS